LILPLLAALALAQQPPVFRAEVETVYLDVFVTREEAPVLGLAAHDFVVSDNGVSQAVRLMDLEALPFSAVLAFDASSSVRGAKLEQLRVAARAFAAGLGQRDEAALLTFSHKIELRQPPTPDREALRGALLEINPRGTTALIDALFLCLKKSWGRGRPLIVLFTDGADNSSFLSNEELLRAARESAALLHVVGTRDPQPPASSMLTAPRREEPGYAYLLRQAAETTGGAFWWADEGALDRAFLKVLAAVSARYVLAYEPAGGPHAGRHRLKVSVKRSGVQVRARQEYVVPAAGPR
jgi:VWFA-related protein